MPRTQRAGKGLPLRKCTNVYIFYRYLKSIMESIPTENGTTFIHMPEVEKNEMEIVLQFLYTGKMKISRSLMQPVQMLLEKVLKIDTTFKLPQCEDNYNFQENSKESNDCIGDGESGYGTDSNASLFDSSFKEPQNKR